jgi:hypothetical protein
MLWQSCNTRWFDRAHNQSDLVVIVCRIIVRCCKTSSSSDVWSSLPSISCWSSSIPAFAQIPSEAASTITTLYSTLAIQLARARPCEELYCRLTLALEALVHRWFNAPKLGSVTILLLGVCIANARLLLRFRFVGGRHRRSQASRFCRVLGPQET